eukprot:364169-Chlamydomonas_euryale.AAC.3
MEHPRTNCLVSRSGPGCHLEPNRVARTSRVAAGVRVGAWQARRCPLAVAGRNLRAGPGPGGARMRGAVSAGLAWDARGMSA